MCGAGDDDDDSDWDRLAGLADWLRSKTRDVSVLEVRCSVAS